MEWQPIETAPKDGAAIQAEIPGHGRDNVISWQPGFINDDNQDVSAWVVIDEQEPPESWCDGVCWATNSNGKPSVLPVRWKPLPIPPDA